MAHPPALQVLRELAAARTDAAARRLGACAERMRAAEEKLEQLETYRAEYRAALGAALRAGVAAARLNDTLRFVEQIDAAIDQQRGEVARCAAAWQAARDEWLVHHGRERAYGALHARQLAARAAREARREQRLHDELAARARPEDVGGPPPGDRR